LRGLSLTVEAGEVVAIIGDSGTGKSTLLHLLGALDRPDKGKVCYDGQDIFEQSDDALSRWRNTSVGFVFQFHHLLPEFSALENVAMPALIAGQGRAQAQSRAETLLEQLGLGMRLGHRPAELSGGEQQRVAVARALMNRPALVLADEPSGSLDTKTAEALHEELLKLSRTHDQAFIIATHNPTLSGLCDRVLLLEDGQLWAQPKPQK
ncbi:MAG: ABC transporter ATP-binding protein, partial [Rhodothermaceae bacterium]|nr:ABC transporter ATP-binding protein [Rhodothermaceae bacterium]